MEGVGYIQEHFNFQIHCSENLTVGSVLCMVILYGQNCPYAYLSSVSLNILENEVTVNH